LPPKIVLKLNNNKVYLKNVWNKSMQLYTVGRLSIDVLRPQISIVGSQACSWEKLYLKEKPSRLRF
jgi:hypothetical protein